MTPARGLIVPRADLAALVLVAQALDESLTQQGYAAAGDDYRAKLRALIERMTALLRVGGGNDGAR